ncbi:MAG TPA: TIGR02996 domain-containing protein, partial [Gemmataceae bacterium]|nr:TIGR02996 domain-containing protein [Gemmataceae bacterium]
MTEADAFLATILENPDDDAPRLVFADWLDEHGETDRAEFIRVQIELAHDAMEAHRRSFLKRREKELLQAHRKEWLKPLYERLQALRGPTSPLLAPGLFQFFPSVLRARNFAFSAGILTGDEPGAVPAREEMVAFLTQMLDPLQVQLPMENVVHCRFRRGFVEFASLLATDFVRFAEVLFTLVPLREIQAYGGPLQRGFGELSACPYVKRLSGLHLDGMLSDDGLDHFTNSPNFTGLRRLDLQKAGVQRDQCPRLLSATNLPAVRELNLSNLQLGNLALTTLARNRNWENVRVLNLSQTGLSDEGILALTGPESCL